MPTPRNLSVPASFELLLDDLIDAVHGRRRWATERAALIRHNTLQHNRMVAASRIEGHANCATCGRTISVHCADCRVVRSHKPDAQETK